MDNIGKESGMGNLLLHRKVGEEIVIGKDIKIKILEVKGGQVRIGIDAPKEVRILRKEIWLLHGYQASLSKGGIDATSCNETGDNAITQLHDPRQDRSSQSL